MTGSAQLPGARVARVAALAEARASASGHDSGTAEYAGGASLADRTRRRDAALIDATRRRIDAADVERVRLAWCDLHGVTRARTLQPHAALAALEDGVSMVGTLALKDTADRTALPVFEGFDADNALSAYAGAANVTLLPEPDTLRMLPWSPGTAWLLGETWLADGSPAPVEPRRSLRGALARLGERQLSMRCGLEIEFHVYRRADDAHLDPASAEWPARAPSLALLHGGYRLLGERETDACDAVLRRIEQVALGLELPLRNIEVEFGPSQFEAVFEPLDALAAADAMVCFRSALVQALARDGLHASFVCCPPFPNAMASGWHLHQSLVDTTGHNVLRSQDPTKRLSPTGERWLAGLLGGAAASMALTTPTANAYARYAPKRLAPTRFDAGADDRASALRVPCPPGDPATRIENRLGEPAANPYLYVASQVISGLRGLDGNTPAPGAFPANLGEALDAFEADAALRDSLGAGVCAALAAVKRQEHARREAADDVDAFDRREYLGRL